MSPYICLGKEGTSPFLLATVFYVFDHVLVGLTSKFLQIRNQREKLPLEHVLYTDIAGIYILNL